MVDIYVYKEPKENPEIELLDVKPVEAQKLEPDDNENGHRSNATMVTDVAMLHRPDDDENNNVIKEENNE